MDVHESRCARAQEEMLRQGVDLLFVLPSSDLVYLIGHHTHTSERLTLFMLPASGEPAMVVPALEAPAARAAATFFPFRTWADGENPYALMHSLMMAAGRKIAVSDQMWSMHLLNMQAELPQAAFTPASRLLAPLRRVKDAAEIAALKRAGAAADAAMAEILAMPLLGKSEHQVARLVADLLINHGHSRADFAIVASGPNSGSPHHVNSDRVLQLGDALTLDFGGVFDDYFSDITRTVFLGAPPDEFRRIYEIVGRAQQAAFAAVRPGVACQEIDRAARRVVSEAGYGQYFIHRCGHGLGLDVHEDPYMVEGNALPLQPGMVFSDEPGIYLPGRFGVRTEDAVFVTETGGERLNAAPRELRTL